MIEHLRESGKTSTIALWGRSMGAATALLHGERDPSIAGTIPYNMLHAHRQRHKNNFFTFFSHFLAAFFRFYCVCVAIIEAQ